MDKRRKRLINRLKRDDHCYWCGRQVVLTPDGSGVLKPFHATIDHKFSRQDIRRYLPSGGSYQVLSCYKCNQQRNIEDTKKLSLKTVNKMMKRTKFSVFNLEAAL